MGILTGDIVLNPEADCVIMTTEILRNKLYRQCSSINNVEWVIFDEVHYINNEDRGSVWEETIILLPKDARLVMLSATVQNVEDFGDWVSRTTLKPLNIIRTYKRPVPLNHNLYYNGAYLLKKQEEKIDEQKYKALLSKVNDSKIMEMKKKMEISNKLEERKYELMNKSNQRERVKKINSSKSRKFKQNILFENKKPFMREEKYVSLIDPRFYFND